jgi:hypothetical protein
MRNILRQLRAVNAKSKKESSLKTGALEKSA